MKQILFLLLTMLTCIAFGQEDKRSQIKAMKTAYLTEELDLSSEEAEKFWPIYNTYRKNLWQLNDEKYLTLHDNYRLDLNEISNRQAIEMLGISKQKEKEEMQLRETFQSDLLKVLPARKVFMLRKVEEGFKRKLLQWYSQKQE